MTSFSSKHLKEVKTVTEEKSSVTQIYLVNYFQKNILRAKFLNTVKSTNEYKFIRLGKYKYMFLEKMCSVKKN